MRAGLPIRCRQTRRWHPFPPPAARSISDRSDGGWPWMQSRETGSKQTPSIAALLQGRRKYLCGRVCEGPSARPLVEAVAEAALTSRCCLAGAPAHVCDDVTRRSTRSGAPCKGDCVGAFSGSRLAGATALRYGAQSDFSRPASSNRSPACSTKSRSGTSKTASAPRSTRSTTALPLRWPPRVSSLADASAQP